jgi:hypothetical protein
MLTNRLIYPIDSDKIPVIVLRKINITPVPLVESGISLIISTIGITYY